MEVPLTVVVAGTAAGVVSAGVAFWGVLTRRAIARRQAAIEFIARSEADRELVMARETFIRLAKEPGGLLPYADPAREGTSEVEHIRLCLNDLELLAIGVEADIIDFDIAQAFYRGTVLRYWARAEPFVSHLRLRTGRPAIYIRLQRLERRMRAAPDGPESLFSWIGRHC